MLAPRSYPIAVEDTPESRRRWRPDRAGPRQTHPRRTVAPRCREKRRFEPPSEKRSFQEGSARRISAASDRRPRRWVRSARRSKPRIGFAQRRARGGDRGLWVRAASGLEGRLGSFFLGAQMAEVIPDLMSQLAVRSRLLARLGLFGQGGGWLGWVCSARGLAVVDGDRLCGDGPGRRSEEGELVRRGRRIYNGDSPVLRRERLGSFGLRALWEKISPCR